MPRAFSSGALSIWSNAVNLPRPLAAWTFVIAAVSVVLPWSTWPIVPMLTCGLLRMNFSFDMTPLDSGSGPGHELVTQPVRHFGVLLEFHRVGGASPSP